MNNIKLVYIVNDIKFFKNHFLEIALNASKFLDVYIVSDEVDYKLQRDYQKIKQYKFKISRSNTNPFLNIISLIQLHRLLKKINPTIIHNITLKPILFGSFFVKFFKPEIKIINSVTGLGYAFTNNDIILKAIIKTLIKLLIPEKSHFLFLNKHDRKFYQNLGKGIKQKFTMINGSGVDKKEFNYINTIKKNKIEIVYTGRILKDKGVINLIDAVNMLDPKLKSKIILKLYGSIDIENPAHISKKELENHLVPGFIEWYGFTSVIKDVLINSDVYCLPSYREGIPKSIIEAMAIGRPILTTDAPGCEDTVEEGINGFKVPVGNINALSEKLQILIEDELLRLNMGNKSREIFEENYSLDKVIKQILDVYKKIPKN